MKNILLIILLFDLTISKPLNIMPRFLMADEQEDIDSLRGEITHFLDFADMMTNLTSNKNVQLFRKSINECPFSPPVSSTRSLKTSKGVKWSSIELTEKNAGYSRLFALSESMFGLVGTSQISFYTFTEQSITTAPVMSLMDTFHFKDKIILDACADKLRNVFVIFSVENKIGKYTLLDSNPYRLIRVRSLVEADFEVRTLILEKINSKYYNKESYHTYNLAYCHLLHRKIHLRKL